MQSSSVRLPFTVVPAVIGVVAQVTHVPVTGRVTGDPSPTLKLTVREAGPVAAGLKRTETSWLAPGARL